MDDRYAGETDRDADADQRRTGWPPGALSVSSRSWLGGGLRVCAIDFAPMCAAARLDDAGVVDGVNVGVERANDVDRRVHGHPRHGF